MSFPTEIPEQQPIDIKTASPEVDVEKAKAAKPAPQNNPVPLERLDNHSAYVECQFCKVRGRTEVVYTSTSATNVMAVGCCCVLGILGVWMPYVFHWGADADHHCSACKRLLVHVDHQQGAVQVQRPAAVPNEKSQYASMPAMKPVHVATQRSEAPQYVSTPQDEAPQYVAVEHQPDLKIAEAPVLPSAC